MTRFTQEGPIWRRALFAAGAMLGASAAFVGVVMLVLMVFVDRAVGATSSDVDSDTRPSDTAATHEQPSTPKGDGKTSTTPPKGTGERS